MKYIKFHVIVLKVESREREKKKEWISLEIKEPQQPF